MTLTFNVTCVVALVVPKSH